MRQHLHLGHVASKKRDVMADERLELFVWIPRAPHRRDQLLRVVELRDDAVDRRLLRGVPVSMPAAVSVRHPYSPPVASTPRA